MHLFSSLQATAHGIDWTGEQIRTALMTLLNVGVGFACRMLWCMRDGFNTLHRDIRGDEKTPGLIDRMDLHDRRLNAIEARNIAIDAVVEAEADLYPGPDRRQSARRMRDAIREAHETGEHEVQRHDPPHHRRRPSS